MAERENFLWFRQLLRISSKQINLEGSTTFLSFPPIVVNYSRQQSHKELIDFKWAWIEVLAKPISSADASLQCHFLVASSWVLLNGKENISVERKVHFCSSSSFWTQRLKIPQKYLIWGQVHQHSKALLLDLLELWNTLLVRLGEPF